MKSLLDECAVCGYTAPHRRESRKPACAASERHVQSIKLKRRKPMIRYRQHFLLAALFALIVFGALTNSHQVSAQQQGPTDGLAVRIVNQPVAVTGSTSVSGNV